MRRLVFQGFRGLNTVSSPEALRYDPRTGSCELAVAMDVDILDGGRRMRRRPGRSRVAAGHWRDAWNAPDGAAYAVVDDVLCEVRADLSTRPLVALQSPGPVVYAALGDLIFWSNGIEAGMVQSGEAAAWGGKTYPVRSEAGRFISPPPGAVLAGFAGRVWIADGCLLCFTAGPGRWHFYEDAAGSIELPGEIAMIRPVDDGLYVGTSLGTYYLAGSDPARMTRLLVDADPVTAPGSDVAVRADEISPKAPPSGACLWTSQRGILCGLPGGIVLKLTHSQAAFDAPAARAAAVWLPTSRRYVVVLHP